MVSLPITLYPRETGLTRWMELLSDGVLELLPFPHSIDSGPSLATSGAATSQEEKPQGMARIHRLPAFHERGGGMPGITGVGDDLAFTVTRRRFMIKPFSLPPIEGDTDAQRGEVEGKPAKAQLEF
jgi:elongator complex protein 4